MTELVLGIFTEKAAEFWSAGDSIWMVSECTGKLFPRALAISLRTLWLSQLAAVEKEPQCDWHWLHTPRWLANLQLRVLRGVGPRPSTQKEAGWLWQSATATQTRQGGNFSAAKHPVTVGALPHSFLWGLALLGAAYRRGNEPWKNAKTEWLFLIQLCSPVPRDLWVAALVSNQKLYQD